MDLNNPVNASPISFIIFNPLLAANDVINAAMLLRFSLPIALPIPPNKDSIPLPKPPPSSDMKFIIGSKFNAANASNNPSTPFDISSIIFPIPLNAPDIVLEIDSNTPLFSAALFILENKLPIEDVTTNIALPTFGKTANTGAKDFSNVVIIFLPKSITENKPLKVALIILAVLSLILNFSVSSWNFLDISTNRLPVIAGNISLNPSLTAVIPFIRLVITLPRPFMTASLPPFSFQNFNIVFLASIAGFIICSNPSLTAVNVLVA